MAEQDRRVRRTRRVLRNALFELIFEKGYDRVTVQDVLDRADVGRSTFYAHYRDKEALLLAAFDELSEELRREFGTPMPGADPARPADAVFRFAYGHQPAFRALCGKRGGDVVQRHLRRLLADLLTEHLGLDTVGLPIPADVVAEFCTSATLGLLDWAIDNGFPHDATWLAATYRRLAEPGLTALLAERA
ncbi:TetR/AcrR family transcriptional regulator [Amycolatopsis sp. NPDC051903]|uniref:TetR/AcrR family transcriptional regulator n=1 Tax=Amycolatopsis sp. NPDC051903 TaxID=3363936 RepID=UPI00378CF018